MSATMTATQQKEKEPLTSATEATAPAAPAASKEETKPRNELLFQIKKIFTAIHFLTLLPLLPMLFAKSDYATYTLLACISSFAIANFIPPVGMISPEEAPEYAKTSMSYMPEKRGVEEMKRALEEMNERDAREAKENMEGKEGKKKGTGNPKKKKNT